MPTMVTRIGVGVPDFAGQVVVFDSFDREDNNYFRMYGIRLRREPKPLAINRLQRGQQYPLKDFRIDVEPLLAFQFSERYGA